MTSFPFPSHVTQPDAEQAARRLRLPFSCCAWKGTQGHWEGTGAGNSIDFQGSRSYQWGMTRGISIGRRTPEPASSP